ncbi:MAG: FecR domain-containing protein, partial [Bacteroidetes bacterium]|nr:FecR domain-containing protein [Bacteroidota bacterium]
MTKNNIIALADKIASGIATDDEIAAYNKIFNGMQAEQPMEPGQRAGMEAALRERIMHRTEAPALRSMGWARWAAAAAILFVIAGAGYVWFFRGDNKSVVKNESIAKQPAEADIRPGTQKAILTLADGSKVVLDSQANGKLAEQGNMSVTKQGGQLQYAAASHPVSQQAMAWNTVTTPRGGQYQLVLGDGTKVWLNAASALRFPAGFQGNTREVEVSGEVYFEVAADAAHPFLVHTGNGTTVKVLGTRFNINAYEDENMIATTLLEGSVQVSRGQTSSLLQPGDQAQLGNKAGLNIVHNADVKQAIAWKDGLFQFNNAGLKTVMRQLSR